MPEQFRTVLRDYVCGADESEQIARGEAGEQYEALKSKLVKAALKGSKGLLYSPVVKSDKYTKSQLSEWIAELLRNDASSGAVNNLSVYHDEAADDLHITWFD